MKSRSGETIKLTSIDELLGVVNEESAMEIDISKIHAFKDHPFKVLDDEKMTDLVESVKAKGVLTPVLLRPDGEDGYEMISGHRRMYAAVRAGLKTIPAIVRELSDDDAVIAMVDANIQREELLPSEKAFAYRMKMEAMKKQAGRPGKDNLRPVVTDLNTADKIGKDNEESGRQVFRYIRLTELIQEILDMVDEKKIAFRPAVEISYLSEDNQYVLLDVMQFSDITPSLAQAIHMKKLEQEGKLDTEKIEDLMSQEKPNQVEKLKFNAERFESVFPKNIKTNQEKEDFIYMCVEEHNQRERAKKRAMER